MLISRMRRLVGVVFFLAVVLSHGPSRAGLVTLHFNDLFVGNCLPWGTELTTQGFTFVGPMPSSIVFICNGNLAWLASNGTGALFNLDPIGELTLTEEDGGTFDLLSFDVAERNAGTVTEVSLDTTGYPGYGTYRTDGTFWDNHGFIGSSATWSEATYASWDLSSVSEEILEAQLSLNSNSGGGDLDGPETLTAYGVSVGLATLEGGSGSYAAITSGDPYGSLAMDPGTTSPLIIPVNGAGLAALNAARGGVITLGFALPTTSPPSDSLTGFASNSSLLELKTGTAAVLDNATAIRIEAVRAGGGDVSASFQLDGVCDGPGGEDDFETFTLSTSFEDLVSVTFRALPDDVEKSEFFVDNIRVVPEPGPGGMGIASFVALLLLARARREASPLTPG